MVYQEKSQPAPTCLETEKAKINGDYKCNPVLDRLREDFKNKCYICEKKEPESINVEHFIPHIGNKDLKYDWNNLFYACVHCNGTKLARYNEILNCTDAADNVETAIKYEMSPFPKERVNIELLADTIKNQNTRNMLMEIYNGSTELKNIEADNLRSELLNEISDFQKELIDYYKSNDDDNRDYHLLKIQNHLNTGSDFTAFKRWIVRSNDERTNDFGHLII